MQFRKKCLSGTLLCFLSVFFNVSKAQYFTDTASARIAYQLAEKHYTNSKFDSSMYYYETAAKLFKGRLDRDGYISSYNKIIKILWTQGKFETAFQKANIIKDTIVVLLPQKHDLLAEYYENIASLYRVKTSFTEASLYLRLALEAAESEERKASVYTEMGVFFDRQGEQDSALHYLDSAIKIYTRLNNENDVANTWNRLAKVYSNNGEYNQGIECANKGLQIALKKDNQLQVAKICNSLGMLYDLMGNYDKALDSYQLGKSIYERILSPSALEVGTICVNQGAVYFGLKEYDKALEHYEKANRIYVANYGENYYGAAQNYLNISETLLLKKEYTKAFQTAQKGMAMLKKLYGEKSSWISFGKYVLANICLEQKNYSEAIKYYYEAADIYTILYGEVIPEKGHVFRGLAKAYYGLKKFNLADSFYLKAIDTYHNTLGHKHPFVAEIHEEIGRNKIRENNYSEALSFLQKALISNSIGFDDSDVHKNPLTQEVRILSKSLLLSTLKEKAKIFLHNYTKHNNVAEIENAYKTLQLAADLTVKLIQEHTEGWNTLSKNLEEAYNIFQSYLATAKLLHSLDPVHISSEQLYAIVEKSKAIALSTLLQENKARQFLDVPDSLIDMEKNLKINLTFYEKQINELLTAKKLTGRDSSKLVFSQDKLFDLKRSHEQFTQYLEKNYPEYYKLKYQFYVADLNKIQQTLPDEKTFIVEYFLADTLLYIFTISKNNYAIQNIPINKSFIRQISRYIKSINTIDKKIYLETAYQLYNKLIAPIYSIIKTSERLIIIPSNELHYLPFEALLTKSVTVASDYSQLPYLINKYQISYHQSTSLWTQSMQRDKHDGEENFIGFAPVFSKKYTTSYPSAKLATIFNTRKQVNTRTVFNAFDYNKKTFTELSYSLTEVKEIRELFLKQKKSAAIYVFQQASEQNFKKQSPHYKYVHIATHGFNNDYSPSLSGLAFAQPLKIDSISPNEEGILFSGEVYNLKLRADLLTLSSCESGIGKLFKGEGLLSLSRGFLYAGASNILYSLWKVNDKSTALLMYTFYKHILSGKSYADALRMAKLKLVHQKTMHPSLWSGFVLMGR